MMCHKLNIIDLMRPLAAGLESSAVRRLNAALAAARPIVGATSGDVP